MDALKPQAMMRARVAGVILGFLMAIGGAPVAGAPPAVAGTTTVSGARSGMAKVTIPQDARLSLAFRDDFTGVRGIDFSSAKELAAIVLVRDVPRPGSALAAVRLPADRTRPIRVVGISTDLCQLEDACSLRKGRYRVYLIAERPTQVQLRFEGLEGRSEFVVGAEAKAGIRGEDLSYLYTSPDGPIGLGAFGGGIVPTVASDHGMLFYGLWFHGPSEGVATTPPADQPLLQIGSADGCYFPGRPPSALAFLPGCALGARQGGTLTLQALRRWRYVQYGMYIGVTSGTHAFGGSVIHTGLQDPGLAGFWVDLAG